MTSFLHPNSKTFRKTPFFPFDKNFVVGLYSILVPPPLVLNVSILFLRR